MSSHEVPLFDLLTGQHEPYSGFEVPISATPNALDRFWETERIARERIQEVFRCELPASIEAADVLEQTVQGIWRDGWRPEGGNVNLWTTDFGSVLTKSLWTALNGKLVFRSPTDLNHVSLWWPHKGIEAFPFHKACKRFLAQDGESLSYFAARLSDLISQLA